MDKNYTLKLKGYVGGWDFDPDYVDYVLDKNKGKDVSVVIDSLGGSLFSGLSVASSFRLHGRVNAMLVGYNASAATIAAMGAMRVSMDRHAMFLVHKSSKLVFNLLNANSDKIQSIIDSLSKDQRDLQKFDLQIASMYASRCKKKKDDLLELMKEDKWLTADEALQWGFVDEVIDIESSSATISDVVACAMQQEGIPMPPGCAKQSIWVKIKDIVGSITEPVAHKSIDMSKDLQNICAASGADEIKAVDGSVSLTVDQAKAVEAKLAADSAEIENLKSEIEALKKEPAEKPVTVIDDKGSKDDSRDIFEAVKAARDIYNSLP